MVPWKPLCIFTSESGLIQQRLGGREEKEKKRERERRVKVTRGRGERDKKNGSWNMSVKEEKVGKRDRNHREIRKGREEVKREGEMEKKESERD